MEDGYPTEETLKRIEEWPYTDCLGLAEFIASIWHYGKPWGQITHALKDDFDHEYTELRLATGGWSGNEEIIVALDRNRMFQALCWYYSQRGGLHVYHIPNLTAKSDAVSDAPIT